MPKVKAEPKNVGSKVLESGVTVSLHELNASTKDEKGNPTTFSYVFQRFANLPDAVKALAYVTSKGEKISGESVALDYINTGEKNSARANKLNEINKALAIREDPEAAIKAMVDQMVIGFGTPREIAEKNVRALFVKGQETLKANSTSAA